MKEPSSYKEIVLSEARQAAMHIELQALQTNTWDLVSLPTGKKDIGCELIYKVKLKADGSLERFKTRLVAEGYNQQYVVDFQEIFSPDQDDYSPLHSLPGNKLL